MALSTSEILTLLVALYGAVLSTVLGVRELRKGKRKVRVTCKMALAPNPAGSDVWEFVSIQAVNDGYRPVEIKMAGLLMSNGEFFTQIRSNMGPLPLPKKIEDGDSITVHFDYSEVERALRERSSEGVVFTKAVVRDAAGKEYASRLPRVLKDRKLAK
jgi:hypothetical protein